MKKLLFFAALSVASLVSAKESSPKINSFNTKTTFAGGWCEIRIYRINADGSRTLVDYSLTYEDSESSCRAKSTLMLMAAELKANVD